MQTPTSPLAGIPGTEATSSKRGYYYQDVISALAWTSLNAGEALQIELAEDFAIARGSDAEVTQVKDVGSSLTLLSGLDFLERALRISEENPGRDLSFVYLTRSSIGEEKSPAHRPNGRAGISYWQEVQRGADPKPLVDVLSKLAPAGSRLATLLGNETVEVVSRSLVQRVVWAVKAPESISAKDELKERVAQIAFAEFGLELMEGRWLWPMVLDAVTDASTRELEAERVLTYEQLRALIKSASMVTVTKRNYASLVSDAELARNPPVAQINGDIEKRLDLLRKTRFLAEGNLEERARNLADDVKDGGACQLGDPTLRARALAQCARALFDQNLDLAEDLLSNAERLAQIQDTVLVRALILAKTDATRALDLIANNRDPSAETIRYAIARNQSDANGIEWLKQNDVAPNELDHGGQFLALWDLLRNEEWSSAVNWLEKIPQSSFEGFPALLWAGAHTLLAWAAADGANNAALAGPPIADEIPLKDDLSALKARRQAAAFFQRFRPIAESWGLRETANLALEFSLWLTLEDKPSRPSAVAEVSRVWKESSQDSRWLPLAVRAGVDLNADELARRIDRTALRYGSLSMDDARARLALVLITPAEKWIDDWPSIQRYISPYFIPGFMQHIYIQGLLQVGRLDDARNALSNASDVPELDRQRFELELGNADEHSLAQYRAAVEQNVSPASLQNLVGALVRSGNLKDAAAFALQRYHLTREHGDAEAYLRLLARQQDWQTVLAFLDTHTFLLEQSTLLARMYVDVLIRFGRWSQAQEVADSTSDLEINRNELALLLAVNSGRWEELNRLLENAYASLDGSAAESLRYGHIATNLGNYALAKRFVKRGVELAPEDPNVLWNGYMLAVRGRWEDDASVRDWLAAALATADSEGSPVESKSLTDLVEMAPKWRERTDVLAKSVAAADMFLALAAEQINRPLASVTVGTAFSNEREGDFRRLTPIGAFAGTARDTESMQFSSVVLDATAMLTLGRLKLLPKLLASLQSIHVPHGTGAWLFSEYARIRFHQPGQIVEARALLHGVARKEMRVADSGQAYSHVLAKEVGVDLAQLIAACESDRSSGKNSFVVRSTPLHRVGSLLGESADVGSSASVFRSTLEVMKSLRLYGELPSQVFEESMEYLTRVDGGWPNETPIPRGATLYLDDLSVAYFQHVGVMKLLADGRFDVVIHSDVHTRAVALSELEDINENVGEVLEGIRQFFLAGQSNGVIRILPQPSSPRSDGGEVVEANATVMLSQLFERAGMADAVICDDRAANRYPAFTYPDGAEIPLRTTIDILDWMLQEGHIDEREWFRSRTSLRRSGYLFIPVSAEELLTALSESTALDGELFESASARAIRESHLLAQAASMLRMPDEAPWLMKFGQEIASAVTAIWENEESDEVAAVKSTWLVELSRFDGFADRMLGDNDEARWINLDAITILKFLMNLQIPSRRRAAYNDWIEKAFLEDVVHARPIVFSSLCQMVRKHLVEIPLAMKGDKDEAVAAAIIGREFLNQLPSSIRDVLFEDDELFEALGLKRSTVLTAHVPSSPEFDSEELYRESAVVYKERATRSIDDSEGRKWLLSLAPTGLVMCANPDGSESFQIAHSPLVSPNAHERLEYAKTFAASTGLEESQLKSWLAPLSDAPISPTKIPAFERDVQDSPTWRANAIRKMFDKGKAGVSELVPTSRTYYERLIPPWSGEATIVSFAESLERESRQQDNFSSRLLWSGHQQTALASGIGRANGEELRKFVSAEIQRLDMWSLVGLIEGLTSRADAFAELLDVTSLVVEKFASILADDDRLELTSAIFGLVDATVNSAGIVADVPVYWRRLATIGHSALIEQAALQTSLDLPSFAQWARGSWPLFQVATLADVPLEPRWNGFMMYPHQLKQEFLGRAMTALEVRRDDIVDPRLKDIVFGDSENSLQSIRVILFSALPGPLEGAIAGAQPLPEPLVELLLASLSDETQPLLHRVQAAAHLAQMGTLPRDAIDKLTQSVIALDATDVTESANDIAVFAMRLSLAAATIRDSELTKAVKQLILGQSKMPIPLRAYAGVTVGGADDTLAEWADSVGHVIARCTSLTSQREDAQYVLYVLMALCDVRPALKPSVAQSYARLQGVTKRLN